MPTYRAHGATATARTTWLLASAIHRRQQLPQRQGGLLNRRVIPRACLGGCQNVGAVPTLWMCRVSPRSFLDLAPLALNVIWAAFIASHTLTPVANFRTKA